MQDVTKHGCEPRRRHWTTGSGLSQQRVDELAGTPQVESEPGAGTGVSATCATVQPTCAELEVGDRAAAVTEAFCRGLLVPGEHRGISP